MPTITISKKELTKNIKKKLSLDEIKDRISFLGTDLESIEGDDINVEIFPNRPDLLSQQGFNRAFSSFIGEKTGLIKYETKKNKENVVIVEKAVEKIRPFTACAIVKKLRLTDQNIKDLIRIQEKLHITYGRNRKKCAIGIYPLEHIKLPITYTAKKPVDIKFQPLEAKKEMTGQQILSQHSAGREYGHLLEGKSLYPIFIDAKNDILSMPPIINSDLTGRITTSTKDVFIECSGFSWSVVHRALAMIVTALADMGGVIEEMQVKYPNNKIKLSPDLKPEKLNFKAKYVNKYLGYDLTDKEIKDYLGKMGIGCLGNKGVLTALIPAYRSDILHPIDLVEDIAIGMGMENIESTVSNVNTIAEENQIERFSNKIREILIGHQLLEIKNFNITNKDSQTSLIKSDSDPVMVASSASKEYNTLRNKLIPSGLLTLQSNKHHEYPQNIFEIGEVFCKDSKKETGINQTKHLAILLCGENNDYTKIRQIMDSISEALGIELNINVFSNELFLKGRCGEIKSHSKTVGSLGEINPEILENFELEMPVAALELNLEELYGVIL